VEKGGGEKPKIKNFGRIFRDPGGLENGHGRRRNGRKNFGRLRAFSQNYRRIMVISQKGGQMENGAEEFAFLEESLEERPKKTQFSRLRTLSSATPGPV
jgi:hypothetical protein